MDLSGRSCCSSRKVASMQPSKSREFSMKRLRIMLILGSVAAVSCAASSQPLPSPAQPSPPASAPAQELPKSYLPGLGEFMGRIQTDHAKLWLAGQARNWELAAYQLNELKEVFSDVQDLVPRYQNIPVGEMIDAIMTGTITDLEGSIATRDFSKFSASFDKLTEACNFGQSPLYCNPPAGAVEF